MICFHIFDGDGDDGRCGGRVLVPFGGRVQWTVFTNQFSPILISENQSTAAGRPFRPRRGGPRPCLIWWYGSGGPHSCPTRRRAETARPGVRSGRGAAPRPPPLCGLSFSLHGTQTRISHRHTDTHARTRFRAVGGGRPPSVCAQLDLAAGNPKASPALHLPHTRTHTHTSRG